jgi:hypothetical protein
MIKAVFGFQENAIFTLKSENIVKNNVYSIDPQRNGQNNEQDITRNALISF